MSPRHNPFRAERLDCLPFVFENSSLAELLARLEFLKFRAAIIGAHGRGKSTLLEALAAPLQARGWKVLRLRLDSQTRDFPRALWREKLPALGARDFILLDGAEQLSWVNRKRFLRAARPAAGVLLTAHRQGILPTLCECPSSSQLLHSLILQLAPDWNQNENFSVALFHRHDGNLRDALRELYDLRAREQSPLS